MIIRIWHGWTTMENAPAYEKLLKNEIFPEIEHKRLKGFKNIKLLKYPQVDEMEFVTIMEFESWEGVMKFAGPTHETAWVPDKAKKLLKKYDIESKHYEY